MKDFIDKIKDFFSYKKNRKIVIVSGIGVVTAVGIVLGITFAPASSLSDSEKSAGTHGDVNITASQELTNSTEQTQDPNQQNANSTTTNQSAGGGGNSDNASQGAGGHVSSGDQDAGNQMGATSLDNGGGDAYAFNPGNEQPPASVNCTITIDCSSISNNGALTAAGNPQLEPYASNATILGTRSITAVDTNGDGRVGVDEALKQACNDAGIQYEFKGSSYVRGINYLYEFNAGPNSGWMYNVNGRTPNKGCNSYYLKGSEDILWYYVISY